MNTPRIAPGCRVQWEAHQNCHVLLYPEGMVQLNDSAWAILSLCDGRHTVEEIVAELQAQVKGEDVSQDIKDFIQEFAESGWIVEGA